MTMIKGPHGTASLASQPDEDGAHAPCPSISIVFNEPAKSLFRWVVKVYVTFPESMSLLGTFMTQPPATIHPANRVVALAYAPGAQGWMVECFAQAQVGEGKPKVTDARADVWISRAKCCGALQLPGVVPVQSEGVGEPLFGVGRGQQQFDNSAAVLVVPADNFRRRLVLRSGIAGAAAGLIAIGPDNSISTSTGKLLGLNESFETAWRGEVWAIGTAAPAAFNGLSVWTEIA